VYPLPRGGLRGGLRGGPGGRLESGRGLAEDGRMLCIVEVIVYILLRLVVFLLHVERRLQQIVPPIGQQKLISNNCFVAGIKAFKFYLLQ
jgi:hypothetical protein